MNSGGIEPQSRLAPITHVTQSDGLELIGVLVDPVAANTEAAGNLGSIDQLVARSVPKERGHTLGNRLDRLGVEGDVHAASLSSSGLLRSVEHSLFSMPVSQRSIRSSA
jgi:hypothetical protein